jgi:hypothetical protein
VRTEAFDATSHCEQGAEQAIAEEQESNSGK